MKSKILVSACLITYNQDEYIEECIKGAVSQKVDRYEIIIGDDCSTDRTSEICCKYAELYPNLIKYYRREQNLGMIGNWITTIQNAKGKYIAICEGDDYWTDPLKLQKQVDFLEVNEDYNLVTTYATRFNQNKGEFQLPKKMEAYTFTYKDIIFNNCSPTCATMIKNTFNNSFTFKEGWGTDSQLWIRVLGLNGKGYKFPKTMAVYRKHDGGVSTITHKSIKDYYDQKKYALRKIEKAKFWNSYFNNTANQSVKKVKLKRYKNIVRLAKRENKVGDFILYASRYFILKYKG